VGLSMNDLMPESQFKLYAVSTRFPAKLAQQVALQHISPGIYDVVWGTDTIRLIVLSQIPDGEHNAIWRLFSANRKLVLQALAGRARARGARGHSTAVLPGLGGQPRLQRQHGWQAGPGSADGSGKVILHAVKIVRFSDI